MARRTFGSVRRLPSGRWQARYNIDGAWHNAPETFDREAHADKWLVTIHAQVIAGRWVDARRVGSVAAIVEAYIDSREHDSESPLSPDTADKYRYDADRHIEDSRLGGIAAADVRVSHVRAWLAEVTAASTVSQAKSTYRLLRAAFNRLVEDEEIVGNPCRIKGAGSAIPSRDRITTDAELEAILEHLEPRWHALVLLGAWVGPRWGELRGLVRADLDLDAGTVHIDDQLDKRGNRRATQTRTGTDEAVIHFPPHLVPILAEHLEQYVGPATDAPVFTGLRGKDPLSASLFGKHWRQAQADAGLGGLRVHDLRRTAGTWATERGGASLASVMRRLRHKTVAAAMIYQRPGAAEDKAIAERLSAGRTTRTAESA